MIVIECIPECIVYHGIYQNTIVHSVTVTSLRNRIWSHGHVLHTTCNHDVRIPCKDHLCCHVDTVQTGTAYNIDRNSGCLDGKSCLDGSLTCHILSKTCLNNTAHVHMIYFLRIYASSVQSLLDHDRAKYRCGSCAESAAHGSDSGTACAC